ncbi:MAG TPA: phosphatidylserine decarboxylase [Casimicrobiaceae bacterium]|nr:phosphatidylserine decarboxylase [Casimicrobiaceae bacterium]
MLAYAAAVVAASALLAFLYWRYVWFFRDPQRTPPDEPGILSPADGTVVYVRRVAPSEDVVVIKRGLSATVRDLMREDFEGEKLVIGIFMSPLDVHYNRAPIAGQVRFVKHHPGYGANRHMGPMHARILLRHPPYYAGSAHIVANERTVTCFAGAHAGTELHAYVVQIGARTVNGIESYFEPGESIDRGQTFGMIRVGSQVDLILPWRAEFVARVVPGDRVRAGESILVR